MILSNTPFELTRNNDLIGTYPKAEAIQFFLNNNLETLDKNKMIVLYGKWGSGKTTIMRFLEKELLTGKKFHPIYFEPWKHEKDNDLTLSLLHLFMDELKKDNTLWKNSKEQVKKLLKTASVLLAGTVKASSITIGDSATTGASFTFSGKDYVEHFENEENDYKSFSQKEKDFRESFCAVEELIAKKLDTNGKIIIFIDDLDRCEPEKTIELLSVIKLFFTYGNRTVFFSGVDKNAINSAIESKYKGVVKSEEYLEKIYDISFNMIDDLDINKLIQNYFPFESDKVDDTDITKEISLFFKELKFTNPRHIKKILNKYEILRNFKSSSELSNSSIMDLIPNIYREDEEYKLQGDYFDTILTIYIIMLFEFNRELFLDCADYDNKILKYGRQMYNLTLQTTKQIKLNSYIDSVYSSTQKILDKNSFMSDFNKSSTNLIALYTIFLPSQANNDKMDFSGIVQQFLRQFDSSSKDKSVLFCLYLESNFDTLKNTNSTYKIENIYKMAKTLL